MPNSAERKLESIMETLQRLAVEAEEGIPILVEGRKDLKALDRLNINGRIICIKNYGSILVDVLEKIQTRSVIVFFDFDIGGRTLVSKVATYLERKGVKVDLVFWKKIGGLVKRDIKDVEGLPSYLERLKNQVYSLHNK